MSVTRSSLSSTLDCGAPEGEVGLRTYEQLKNRGGFSEELLSEVLRGMSARKYEETVTAAGKAFGVTPSSVSRHLVEATAKQLKQFQERSLEEFPLFAMLPRHGPPRRSGVRGRARRGP